MYKIGTRYRTEICMYCTYVTYARPKPEINHSYLLSPPPPPPKDNPTAPPAPETTPRGEGELSWLNE
jgi:hypothetical protein